MERIKSSLILAIRDENGLVTHQVGVIRIENKVEAINLDGRSLDETIQTLVGGRHDGRGSKI